MNGHDGSPVKPSPSSVYIVEGHENMAYTPTGDGIGKEPFGNHKTKEKKYSKFLTNDTLFAFGYLIALTMFICGYNIRGLSKLPYPAIGNLVDVDSSKTPKVWNQGILLILAMWGFIHIRKLLCLIIRNRQKPDYHPILYSCTRSWIAPVLLFHFIMGFWTGWSVNFHLGYKIPDLLFFIPGIVIFSIGELVALCAFVIQYVKEVEEDYLYVVVEEFFEILSWLGIAVSFFTLPSIIVFLSRVGIAFFTFMKRKTYGMDGC